MSLGVLGFTRRVLPVMAIGAVMAAAACLPDDQRTDSIEPGVTGRAELSAETLAQIDSGNAAFRRDDFETAIARFQEATQSAPDDPTGWFGLYMAHTATGDAAAADDALARARELAPGASLIRMPAEGEGGGEGASQPDSAGGGSP
ncbi:MAG: tetratricopeptide repeat protein [Gemmatimonadetes bacterium]|nr:tetratricopeptide repeat protein [Gemmatimonadota bacterium]MBT8402323.1 tetratricopeptide repeat protein [Gemmatimonadota bacterium]NNF38168.1 tetratricopeptide repeat protein [Gemmatimonadota bacterium]NNK63925.1 tetratricopeptide repeat protein [Gemmatimonadota bacterium]